MLHWRLQARRLQDMAPLPFRKILLSKSTAMKC
jgi:hypothetical protein